jgi:hypothetical protein
MKRLLYSGVAVTALLCASAVPSSAASIEFLGAGGSVAGLQASPIEVVGTASGTSALSFTTDYLNFAVSPSGLTALVQIVDLGVTYPNEQFQIKGSNGATVVGPTDVTGNTQDFSYVFNVTWN